MPKYRFEFSQGHSKPNVVMEFSDDDTARHEALRTATQLSADAAARGAEPSDWSVTVYDEAGKALNFVTLSDIKISGDGG